MAEKGLVISNGLKWVLGIMLTIMMSVSGYALKRDMDTNGKIVELQTNVIQAQEELIELWRMVNESADEKEGWIIVITEMKGEIKLMKYEIEEVKKNKSIFK